MAIRRRRPVDSERLATVFRPAKAATGNGVADDHAAMQAELTAAAGKTWVVAPGANFYRLTAPLAVPANTTILLMPGVVIEQVTKYTPVFDVLDADDVVIDGGGALLRYTGSRVATSPASFRGSSGRTYGAGAWANGNRCRIRNLRVFGFQEGVFLSSWDGATLAEYGCFDNVVENIDCDTVDWGLLFCGQVNFRFSGIRGNYALASGSADPAHLVYGSEPGNRNVTAADCAAIDGSGGVPYSIKAIDGGSLRGLAAYNCPGWLGVDDCVNATFAGESHGDLGEPGTASLYFVSDSVKRCSFDFLVEMANAEKTVRVQGVNNRIVVKGRVRHPASSDNYDVHVTGTDNEVDVDLVNIQGDGTDYTTGYRTVGLAGGSGHRATVRRAKNTKYAVTVASGVTGCSVDYDPHQISRASSFPVDSALILAEVATTHVNQPRRVLDVTIASAGQTVTVDPALYDAVEIRVDTNDAFTIANPLGGFAHARMTYMIWNNSGGAMGTITWGAGYVFYSAWANPGATVRKHIAFMRDSVNAWREVSRNA